jgi:hypothetical protein
MLGTSSFLRKETLGSESNLAKLFNVFAHIPRRSFKTLTSIRYEIYQRERKSKSKICLALTLLLTIVSYSSYIKIIIQCLFTRASSKSTRPSLIPKT